MGEPIPMLSWVKTLAEAEGVPIGSVGVVVEYYADSLGYEVEFTFGEGADHWHVVRTFHRDALRVAEPANG